jgi:Protein of unknown function (DUF433)
MSERISIKPDVCNGRPAIRGTRITVQTVLEFLAAGDSVEDVRVLGSWFLVLGSWFLVLRCRGARARMCKLAWVMLRALWAIISPWRRWREGLSLRSKMGVP